MSTRVKRGTFRRSCRTCGWAGTYDTAGKGDHAKRLHSCEKQLRDAARRANGEKIRERNAQIDRTPKPCLHKIADHQHGTYACYTLDACRCLPCAEAVKLYEQQRVRNIAYGRSDMVDAEPVRAHITALGEQGMGLKRVAKAAGVSTGSLSKLMWGVYAPLEGPSRGRYGKGELVRGPSKRVRRATAAKVLAVELDLADGVQVDATGTTRRVRALVALGWSQSKLAGRLGILRSNFHHGRGTRPTVLASTAKAVVELYDELSMTLPPEKTHRDKIAASRARRYAKARGWLPPLALDDEYLDDPTYKPSSLLPDVDADAFDESAIQRRMSGDRRVRLTKAEKAELVQRWVASGRSLNEMERLTGVNTHRYQRKAVS